MKCFLSTSIIILFGGLSFNYFNDDSRKINILREREREHTHANPSPYTLRKRSYDFVKCWVCLIHDEKIKANKKFKKILARFQNYKINRTGLILCGCTCVFGPVKPLIVSIVRIFKNQAKVLLQTSNDFYKI